MEETTDTRLKVGRRFAIEIALGCALVAALLSRHGDRAAAALSLEAAAVALLAIGALRPALLAPVARRWLAVGAQIARVTTPVFLAVIYVVVLTPIGFVRRRVFRSPIHRDRAASTFWVTRDAVSAADARAAMEHQF